MIPARSILDIETPALLLSESRLNANINRLKKRLSDFGVALRPHIKTCKSRKVYERALGPELAVTVSTLAEAEYAFEKGARSILYAVGMAAVKLDRAAALAACGADLILTVDSLDAARAIAAKGAASGLQFSVVMEIDSDGHRAGLKPCSDEAQSIAQFLATEPGARFRGVMTHAGGSYDARNIEEIRAIAERERRAVVETAAMLSRTGVTCEIVSVGSTPTATFGERFDGVTEVRAGVFMFNDLVMAGLGVCEIDNIAISVLASVIGHQRDKGWIITDAGWMALSRDLGNPAGENGYGLVCDEEGSLIDGLAVVATNQEHGVIAARGKAAVNFADFPIGAKLRVLPNHACATAAQFAAYEVLDDHGGAIARWPRLSGW
jgi:D-serine deaminase-like pyridoxal phosphate-dependent protein